MYTFKLFRSAHIQSLATLRLFAFFCLAAAQLTSATAQAQTTGCDVTGKKAGQAGPWDYRHDRNNIPLVENHHFTPKVEALLSGESGKLPAPDIDYTLIHFPNHPRALISLVRLGQRMQTEHVNGMRYSIGCYFDRAIYFRPDDTVVRVLYSQYLDSLGRSAEAVSQLEIATAYAKDSGFSHFNIGMAFFDLKNYQQARKQATEALRLGFERTELVDRLKRVGEWDPSTDALKSQNANDAAAAASDSLR